MQLSIKIEQGGAILQHKPTLLGKKVAFDQWIEKGSKQQLFAFSQLQSLMQDRPQEAYSKDAGVFISDAIIADFDEPTALALGLPPSTKLAVRLKANDEIKSEQFRVITSWVRAGGLPTRATVTGAFVHDAGQTYRLPNPIYSMHRAAIALSAPLAEPERLDAYASLAEIIKTKIAPDGAEIDTYLEEVTVYHAAAFSLKLGVHDDQFDFDPVLFARDSVQDAEDGNSVDEVSDALLPPTYQDLFARKWFRHFRTARSAYPLKDGSLVVLDRHLVRAMNAVRSIQDADSETRRAFITSPTRFLKEIVGENADEVVDLLFIETEQFSKRVKGVDIWRSPVLPWVKPTPNSWIPESFGVRIGDDYVTLSPQGALEAKRILEEAAQAGEAVATIRDEHGERVAIPTTEQAISAITDIADIAVAATQVRKDDAQHVDDGPHLDPPEFLSEKRFLTVHENFEDVEFEALISPSPEKVASLSTPNIRELSSSLKPHQKEGLGWLWSSLNHRYPGVLLADDMGLGKTLQVLAFLSAARGVYRDPALIIAPTGLLSNWRREIATHFSDEAFPNIVEAYGSGLKSLKRTEERGHDTAVGRDLLDSQHWADADIVLTTYETMRDFHFSFAKTKFGVIAFDEIQKLKNPASQVSRAARSLNGRISVGMTGTPVENRLQDLWSIIDVLWPGKLGSSRAFEQAFPASSSEKLEQLRDMLFQPNEKMPPVALRRMKADQLEGLPRKIEHPIEVDMPGFQASEYQKSVVRARAMKEGSSPSDSMLRILHELRMISLHPTKPDLGGHDLAAYAAESARLKQTLEILTQIQEKGEKALIFLESLEMQSFLASAIQRKFGLPERPYRIHGGVKGADRQAYVNSFQQKPPGFDVMILSPKAGGVGLTLTAANHVIHLTRWWNPAVEDQSTDRAYRIGQSKDVHVYYPMAVHPSSAIRPSSFDLRLHALLQRKRALSVQMLAPPEDARSDAAELFSGIVDTSPLPERRTEEPQAEAAPDRATTARYDATEESAPSLLKAAEASPHLDAETGPTFYQCAEGELPDLKRAFSGVSSKPVTKLLVSDPYLMTTDTNRRCTATFLHELVRHFGPIRRVQLEFAPPQIQPGADVESETEAHHQLRALLAVLFQRSGHAMPQLGWQTRRRTKERDFHDRYVHFYCGTDEATNKTDFLLTGGIDRLMRKEFSVAVFLLPQGAELEAAE